MTPAELDHLIDLANGTWPSLLEWFAGLPPATKQIQRDRRKLAVGALEASDVRRAIEELSRLPRAPWQEYGDRPENAWATIGDAARQIGGRRREASEAERAMAHERDRGRARAMRSIREEAEALAEARRLGQVVSASDVLAWLNRDSIDGEHDRRDAHACRQCRDTGLVTCVSTLRHNHRGQLYWTTAAAACGCGEGDRFAERREELHRLPRYDDTRHVRVVQFATPEDVLAELTATRERAAKAKRFAFLDEHNQRAGATT